jgi:hypothetical protein
VGERLGPSALVISEDRVKSPREASNKLGIELDGD